ncbi:MAG: hypothetical protein ACN4GW_05540 [Desulforhopalus sp.]
MKIGIIGDYDQNRPSHVATSKAIQNTAKYLSIDPVVQWIPTQSLLSDVAIIQLQEFDGIWVAPGEPESSLGVINAIQVARENNIPLLGT